VWQTRFSSFSSSSAFQVNTWSWNDENLPSFGTWAKVWYRPMFRSKLVWALRGSKNDLRHRRQWQWNLEGDNSAWIFLLNYKSKVEFRYLKWMRRNAVVGESVAPAIALFRRWGSLEFYDNRLIKLEVALYNITICNKYKHSTRYRNVAEDTPNIPHGLRRRVRDWGVSCRTSSIVS
jgi:hypothetical protein